MSWDLVGAGWDRKGGCGCGCARGLLVLNSDTSLPVMPRAVQTPCPFCEIFVFLFRALGGLRESPLSRSFISTLLVKICSVAAAGNVSCSDSEQGPAQSPAGHQYLLWGLEQLLGYSCSKDGPVASRAELQREGQPRHQLHSQVSYCHLLVQDCHCLLSQDGI